MRWTVENVLDRCFTFFLVVVDVCPCYLLFVVCVCLIACLFPPLRLHARISICHHQIELMEEAAFDGSSQRVSQNYVKAALGALMPVVLETLLKQDEDSADDSEHWDLGQ